MASRDIGENWVAIGSSVHLAPQPGMVLVTFQDPENPERRGSREFYLGGFELEDLNIYSCGPTTYAYVAELASKEREKPGIINELNKIAGMILGL